MSQLSFEIDPFKVLGVPADASLEQIRDAYRAKAKKYHPDTGGEDWAFRILSQAHELLCSARVVRATHFATSPTPAARPRHDPSAETTHPGIHDKDVDPSRVVAVEHLCVRYLWDDASYLWLGQSVPEQERFLSCSLNINWPNVTGLEAGASDPRPEIRSSRRWRRSSTRQSSARARSIRGRASTTAGSPAGSATPASIDPTRPCRGSSMRSGSGDSASGSGPETCSSPGPGSSTARSRPAAHAEIASKACGSGR